MPAKRSALALAFSLLALGAAAARADYSYIVNSPVDDVDAAPGDGYCATKAGACTLRAAIMEANAHALSLQHTTIYLLSNTYTLSIARVSPGSDANGDLKLIGDVELAGNGPDVTTIDAAQIDRALEIAATATVAVSGVTFKNGLRAGDLPEPEGGAIASRGKLALTDCVLVDNASSATGGAIHVYTGELTLTRTVVSGNGAHGGGGISVDSGSLVLVDSTVRANGSVGAFGGGGILSLGSTTLLRSTVSENTSQGPGAGLSLQGPLLATNATIALNHLTAPTDTAGVLVACSCNVVLANVTLFGNTDSTGGPSGITSNGASVVLRNSILSDCSGGTFSSNGYNVITSPGCTGISPGEFLMADPQLGPLADNGGLTRTLAPAGASPAVDAGDPAGCTDAVGAELATDQRGLGRPIGLRCDLGSVEVELAGDVNADGVVNVADVFRLINFLFAGGAPLPGRGDVNADGVVDVRDVFYLIGYLFAGGPAPL